jgi:putative addiction module killer protein
MHKELRFYRTPQGKEPFTKWFSTVKDKVTKAHIKSRLDRLTLGHYGDYKALGHGIYELRIHYGCGYRIYFAEHDPVIILLLLGGDKSTQQRDIEKAKSFWLDFKERCYE